MSKLDEIEARVNARMAEIDRRLGGLGASQSSAGAAAGKSSPAAERLIRAAIPAPIAGFPNSSADQWELSYEALLQLLNYVTSSPHVTGNAQYATLVPSLQLRYASKQEINAYAEFDGNVPTIYVMPGAVRYANIVSAAYVACTRAREKAPDNFSPLPEVIDALSQLVMKTNSVLTAEGACAFAEQYNLHFVMYDQVLLRKARSFASGLLIGILAHEFGHLVLGHCSGKTANLEVSRNQEREADSFASSVISSSPFADYMVFGAILWEMLWVWLEKKTGTIATTHPLASERLADLIRANPTTAAELGLSVPAGTSLLSDAEVAALGQQAAGALAGGVKFDWTSGTICAFGCLGECHGN